MLPFMSNEARGWREFSWTTTDLPVLYALFWDNELVTSLDKLFRQILFKRWE